MMARRVTAMLLVLVTACNASLARALPVRSSRSLPADMVVVRGGRFTPFYMTRAVGSSTPAVEVETFCLDRTAVTNGQFLTFVKACPQWRRSRVKRLFAEGRYLASWRGDLEVDPELRDAPVTFVSWFAARAYAAWRGKRLPSQMEWEYAACASETLRDARRDAVARQRVLDGYARLSTSRLPAVRSTFRNVYGVWDLHGLVWEWVDDYSSLLLTGESREDGGLDRSLFCAAGVLASTDASDYAAYLRHAFRYSLGARFTLANLGFRCALTIPERGGRRR